MDEEGLNSIDHGVQGGAFPLNLPFLSFQGLLLAIRTPG